MKYYEVGKIVNTHGIKGDLKVISKTDFPEDRFSVGSKLYINENNEYKEYTVIRHRTHKQFEIIAFKGLENINLVETLKGKILEVSEKQQKNLNDGTYYHHQIIGLKVVSESNDKIGVITEIMTPGANDVWIVKREDKKDLLLPAIKDVVKMVDLDKGVLVVELLDGMDD